MKQHDKIATRLSIILTKLNNGERISIEELCEEFNVSRRTIQRDLNERFSSLPLVLENGYYFLEEYCLGKLNYQDIKNFAALSGIKNLYPALDDDFIVDLLNTRINKNYLVKGHVYEDMSSKKELFDLLNIAIVTNTKIQFTYKEKKREVAPYRLINTNGIWYLIADENKSLKTFTIGKIEQLIKTDKSFKVDEGYVKQVDQNEGTWFSHKNIDVTLEISNDVKDYFLRRSLLPKQKTIELKNDSIILSTQIAYENEILKVVRYWMPHIKILKPTYLQDKLEKELKQYLNL